MNKDTVQNPIDKLNIEKMHKFLGKLIGFFGIICIGFPIFIIWIHILQLQLQLKLQLNQI